MASPLKSGGYKHLLPIHLSLLWSAKAWAELWLNCPALQCWVQGLLGISTAFPPVSELRACCVPGRGLQQAQQVWRECTSRTRDSASQQRALLGSQSPVPTPTSISAVCRDTSSCVLQVWLRDNFFGCPALWCHCLGIDAAKRRWF